jgi:alpha-ribazole phosphatase
VMAENYVSAYIEDGRPVIFLMRHGHIDTGGERRYVGRTDYPLSPTGKQQAEAWRRLFKDVPLSRVVCSGLRRTREAALIIAPQREIETIPGLNEINMGQWENLSLEKVKADYPREFEARGRNPGTFRLPGGESFADVQKRVLDVFLPFLQDTGGCQLVLTHAGVNRVILCHLLGIPLDNLFRFAQDFACLNVITAGAAPVVRALNLRPV